MREIFCLTIFIHISTFTFTQEIAEGKKYLSEAKELCADSVNAPRSLILFRQALNVFSEHLKWDEYNKGLLSINECLKTQNELEEMIPILKESIKILPQSESNNFRITWQLQLAQVYLDLSRYDQVKMVLENVDQTNLNSHHRFEVNLLNGIVFLRSFDNEKALEAFNKCESLLANGDDISELFKLKLYINTGNALASLKRFDEAKKYAKIAEGIEVLNDFGELGEIYSTYGHIFWGTGYYDSSIFYRERAIPLNKEKYGKYSTMLTSSYGNLADSYRKLGYLDKANGLYNKALEVELINSKGYNSKVPYWYYQIAGMHIVETRNEEAMEYIDYAIASEQLNEESYSTLEQWLYSRKITILQRLNQEKEMLSLMHFCDSIWGEDRPSAANDLYSLGRLYFENKQFEKSEKAFKESILVEEARIGFGNPNTAVTALYRARALTRLADFEEAKVIMDWTRDVLFQKIGKKGRSIGTYYTLTGDYFFFQEMYDSAFQNYHNAVLAWCLIDERLPISFNPSTEYVLHSKDFMYSLLKKAESAQKLNENVEALRIYQTMDSLLSLMRIDHTKVRDKILVEQKAEAVFSSAISACYDLFEETGDTQYIEKAFYFIERNKSGLIWQSFKHQLAKQFGIPQELSNLDNDIKNKISLITTQIKKLDQEDKYYHSLVSQLFELKRSKDSVIHVFEDQYPAYYKLKYDNATPSIPDLKQILGNNTMLVEYVFTEQEGFLFSYYNESSRLQKIEINELADRIKEFRYILDNLGKTEHQDSLFDAYQNHAQELYQLLLPEKERSVINTGEVDKLLVIPSNEISSVPFEILLTHVDSSHKTFKPLSYLLRDVSISYAYSINSIDSKRMNHTHPKNKYLGVAPTYGDVFDRPSSQVALASFRDEITELKYNVEEIHETASLFDGDEQLGEFASESNFKKIAPNYNILHLAMHALIDNDDPMNSKLVFDQGANDTIEDGFLHTFELLNMELNPQLVVLSACNTGIGKNINGEGVMSLAYGFAYAGSPSVVMSHWSVDDQSTSILMKLFYQYLAKGFKKSEALRLAKLEFLDTYPAYANPSYWAGFVVLGSDDPVKVKNNNLWWVMAALLVAILIISGAWRYYRRNS